MLHVHIRKKLTNFDLLAHFEMNREMVALVGPSGSGKTTLLECMAGIVQPDEGHIQLNERVLFEAPHTKLKIQQRKIGYLFQDYALFPHMTVEENIYFAFSQKQRIDFVENVMQEFDIDKLRQYYPHQISGGEKQRVALTRALAVKPDMLLLDEPFSALDDESRYRCQHELQRLHETWEIPILFVTHRKEDAKKLANRIFSMEQGNLMEIPLENFSYS